MNLFVGVILCSVVAQLIINLKNLIIIHLPQQYTDLINASFYFYVAVIGFVFLYQISRDKLKSN
jgi:hypothetical protein